MCLKHESISKENIFSPLSTDIILIFLPFGIFQTKKKYFICVKMYKFVMFSCVQDQRGKLSWNNQHCWPGIKGLFNISYLPESFKLLILLQCNLCEFTTHIRIQKANLHRKIVFERCFNDF